jgi:CheY-like chemotaxis protein
MDARHKILLVDDDPALLELFQQLLAQLPSKPDIVAVSSGPRAMALLEAEPFRLLVCDLKMPKMDGLQVLSIVRRKFPELRTVALTAVPDEQFRSRVYALGVDLFWHKPATEQETKMFLECIESLLGQEFETGFRGLQSKSLVDIIQLECISQSSSVLRITNNQRIGKIWILDGELIDAEADELGGEAAFRKILSWRTGSFETLPSDPARPRVITTSYNALLLESAQAIDECAAGIPVEGAAPDVSPLARVSQIDGIEFVLVLKAGNGQQEARGLENPDRMAAWSRQTLERFNSLGDHLQAGPLEQLEGVGPQRNVALARQADAGFCVGWKPSLSVTHIREMMKKVTALWVS